MSLNLVYCPKGLTVTRMFYRDKGSNNSLVRIGFLQESVFAKTKPMSVQFGGDTIGNERSSTHWDKLTPRVELGGGGECPLLLIGIEPERVDGIEVVQEVFDELAAADVDLRGWRDRYGAGRYREAQAAASARRRQALDRLPPIGTSVEGD